MTYIYMTDKYKNELPPIKTCGEAITEALKSILDNLMQQREIQIESLDQTEKNINLIQDCIKSL